MDWQWFFNNLLGSHTYRLGMGKGSQNGTVKTFYTTVPLVLSTNQILVGSGRALAAQPEDGSTGTVVRACDGNINDSACIDGSKVLYFPNAPPVPPSSATANSSGGNLPNNTTIYSQVAWVVNLASGCDSKPSSGSSGWTSWGDSSIRGKAIFAGRCVTDGTYTEMALTAGTAGGSTPTAPAVGHTVQDGGVLWLNVGQYPSTGFVVYGTPGLSLPNLEQTTTVNSVTNHGKVTWNPAMGAYPNCQDLNGVFINNGTYVLGPEGDNSHTYRAIGSGTLNVDPGNSCNSGSMSTVAGSQTQDQSATGIYWQEVGPPTNYLTPVGYIVYAATQNGTETAQSATVLCNGTTINIGALTACKYGSPAVLTDLPLATNGTHPPVIDTTHALIVLGEKPNGSGSNSTFMTRVQDLTADSNNIAGESCLYVYAQEQSGCYGVNAISATEATFAAIGPGSQNSMIYDFVASNPNNVSGPYYLPRLAGIYLDARDGPAMKTVMHGTITPYSKPAGSSVFAGLSYIGSGSITIESVHTENVTNGIYCDGYSDSVSSTKANCFILSTDPASGASYNEENTVLIGQQANSYYVNTVSGMSTNAFRDDTIALVGAGLGNCNSGNSLCYTRSGTYQAGVADVGSLRTRIPSAPLQTSWFDGPLFLSNAGNAGSIGLHQGSDVSGGWAPNTVTIEAPDSVTSYRLQFPSALPTNNNSAILFSAPGGTNPSVGSFAKMPRTGIMTSAQANLTTLADLSNLSFTVEANTSYVLICTLYYQVSATSAKLAIAITGPNSPTFVTYGLFDPNTATGIALGAAVATTGFGSSLSGVGNSISTANIPATITMGLRNGSNADTVQVQAGRSGTGTVTVQKGSYCQMQ